MMQETWVQSLGWEDPLVEGMTTHSSILSWRIPMDGGAWWATVHGVSKSWTRLNQLSSSSNSKVSDKLLSKLSKLSEVLPNPLLASVLDEYQITIPV